MGRSFAAQHPVLAGLGVLFVLGLIIKYWWVIAAAAALAAIAYGGIGVWENHRARQDAEHQRRQELAARATYEHNLYLQGHPAACTGSTTRPPPDRGGQIRTRRR